MVVLGEERNRDVRDDYILLYFIHLVVFALYEVYKLLLKSKRTI